ncbi:MAG: glycosyltransferase, partial [Dehalococcoidia bacterium]|nr:glycosyltransferase [Dehalococcoidia bacterium]
MSKVVVVCQNLNDDRIIPRRARALRDGLGWTLVPAFTPSMSADVVYLSGYFEVQKLVKWPDVPVAAYLTHREEEPPGNAKAKLFDSVAERVQLRVATCRMYAKYLEQYGPTAQMPAPLERDRFVIPKRKPGARPVVGLSGYTYNNQRKGEDLIKGMLASEIAQKLEWRASGRGWPVPTKRFTWADMPKFYQDLDVLVVPSRVEGIPMPPLEALACGVRIVIPHNVGLHDELPDVPGIYRYDKGDLKTLVEA